MNNRVYTRRPKKMVIAEIQSACVAVFHFCTDLSTEPSPAARLSTSAKPILGEGGGERKQWPCQRIPHWTLTSPVRTPRCSISRAWEVGLLLVLIPTGLGPLIDRMQCINPQEKRHMNYRTNSRVRVIRYITHDNNWPAPPDHPAVRETLQENVSID